MSYPFIAFSGVNIVWLFDQLLRLMLYRHKTIYPSLNKGVTSFMSYPFIAFSGVNIVWLFDQLLRLMLYRHKTIYPSLNKGVTSFMNYPFVAFSGVNIVWLFDPDDIKKMFDNEGSCPARRSHLALEKYRLDRPDLYNNGGLLPTNGSEWSRLRLASQQPLALQSLGAAHK